MNKNKKKRHENQLHCQEVKKEFVLDDGFRFILEARTTLLEMCISMGTQALGKMLQDDVTALCSPRYNHDSERENNRWGKTKGPVTLGGQRLTVEKPRVRNVEGKEVQLPSFNWFSKTDALNETVLGQIISGVTTRKYKKSLETSSTPKTYGSSKSSVSRRFVMMTAAKLAEWQSKSIADLDLVVLMIDGVHFGDHTILVAVGIDNKGNKHVLGIQEGATENSRVCKDLLEDLIDRGLSSEGQYLFVIDGSKALRKAIKDVFGKWALIQRCQEHKIRNVTKHLGPRQGKTMVELAMRQAYQSKTSKIAKDKLLQLISRIEVISPGAAKSLKEGLEETLTVIDLKIPTTLRKSLQTTNIIESTISIVDNFTKNVKQWKNGMMVMRWVATGLLEAEKKFRKLRGYKHLASLQIAIERKIKETIDKEGEIA